MIKLIPAVVLVVIGLFGIVWFTKQRHHNRLHVEVFGFVCIVSTIMFITGVISLVIAMTSY